MATNYHIFKVKYIGRSQTKEQRISIKSERFKQTAIIPYNDTDQFTPYYEQAEAELQRRGFNIIGHGEGTGHFNIISDTFEPLKK
jgi:hypothetical protein